jgi:hypothetical protein
MTYPRSSHLAASFKFQFSSLLNIFAGFVLLGLLGGASPLLAQVTTAQAAVNFGSVAVGSEFGRTQSLSFTVPSGITLGGISALTLGAANLDFTQAPSGTCATGVTAATCTVQVRFRPTAVGARMGALVLTGHNGNTLITVPLSGTGRGPRVAFEPGTLTTVAGSSAAGYGFSGNGGPATSAQLHFPSSVAVDGAGNIYIADSYNNLVRKVTPGGTITTVAGQYQCCVGSLPIGGYGGDGGPATSALLSDPFGVAVDGAGNLFIADNGNYLIRKVTPGGIITTVAGHYQCCSSGNPYGGFSGDNGPATSAQLAGPISLTVDGAGNLYFVDGERIRKVALNGTITTVAGNGVCPIPSDVCYSGDGGPATSAQFNSPTGVAVDGTGALYIADSRNGVVRKVTPGGIISTVPGTYSGSFATSGHPPYGNPAGPFGVAVDGVGNLFIAAAYTIYRVTPAGAVAAVASGEGSPVCCGQLFDAAIVVDGSGNLYLAENVISRIDFSDPPSLSFASTAVGGASAAQDLSVVNLGNAMLDINGISIAPNFSLSGSGSSCGERGHLLNPAASCVLGIEFNPRESGSISGSVVLTDNALNTKWAEQTIPLRGIGTAATATITRPHDRR